LEVTLSARRRATLSTFLAAWKQARLLEVAFAPRKRATLSPPLAAWKQAQCLEDTCGGLEPPPKMEEVHAPSTPQSGVMELCVEATGAESVCHVVTPNHSNRLKEASSPAAGGKLSSLVETPRVQCQEPPMARRSASFDEKTLLDDKLDVNLPRASLESLKLQSAMCFGGSSASAAKNVPASPTPFSSPNNAQAIEPSVRFGDTPPRPWCAPAFATANHTCRSAGLSPRWQRDASEEATRFDAYRMWLKRQSEPVSCGSGLLGSPHSDTYAVRGPRKSIPGSCGGAFVGGLHADVRAMQEPVSAKCGQDPRETEFGSCGNGLAEGPRFNFHSAREHRKVEWSSFSLQTSSSERTSLSTEPPCPMVGQSPHFSSHFAGSITQSPLPLQERSFIGFGASATAPGNSEGLRFDEYPSRTQRKSEPASLRFGRGARLDVHSPREPWSSNPDSSGNDLVPGLRLECKLAQDSRNSDLASHGNGLGEAPRFNFQSALKHRNSAPSSSLLRQSSLERTSPVAEHFAHLAGQSHHFAVQSAAQSSASHTGVHSMHFAVQPLHAQPLPAHNSCDSTRDWSFAPFGASHQEPRDAAPCIAAHKRGSFSARSPLEKLVDYAPRDVPTLDRSLPSSSIGSKGAYSGGRAPCTKWGRVVEMCQDELAHIRHICDDITRLQDAETPFGHRR